MLFRDHVMRQHAYSRRRQRYEADCVEAARLVPVDEEHGTLPSCRSAAWSAVRRWDNAPERWRVYFTDDEPPEPVTYCPVCSRREFGD